MTQPPGPAPSSISTAHPPSATGAPSPITSPLAPDEAMGKLAAAAKAGRLPGFVRGEGDASFRVSVLAGIFDHDLWAVVTGAGPTSIEFQLRPRKPLVIVMIAAVIISFWPGLPITDSMLRLYFPSYHEWGVETWWWYLPLVAISIPPLWKQWKRAQRQAQTEATGVAQRIASLIGGQADSRA